MKWQSEIEHIQSGRSWSFNSLEELGAFLQQPPQGVEGLAWIDVQMVEPPGAQPDA